MTIAGSVRDIFPTIDQIPETARLAGPVDQRTYVVDGQLRQWSGECRDVFSPVCVHADRQAQAIRLGSFPIMDETTVMSALEAATRAYDSGRGAWPTMSVEQRIGHVLEFTRQMKEARGQVVRMIMWEIGKSLEDSEKEFDRTVTYILDTVEALKELDRTSSRMQIQQGVVAQIRRAPLGVALCMGPYNYPLNETFTTLIPALIMGNTIVFKPPRRGVLLFEPLLRSFQSAFPPGVLNTVYGDGRVITPPLMASGAVDCLAFIGSSKAADSLKAKHPKVHRLRSILGLDAKNAGIILPDADIELAVKECVLGSLSFNGQRCTALKILFVHRSIADDFVRRFSTAVSALCVGMPWKPGVRITPLPDPDKPAYLQGLINDAVTKGAAVVNDGGGTTNQGFMFPAVVYPVRPGMALYTEEQFGPVVPIVPFDSVNEPIRYIIESNYGQQASVFGRDPAAVAALIDPLVNQVCRLNINSQCQRGPDTFPFTGRKDSAEGTLSVSDALRCFSIRTLVAAKSDDANREILTRIVRERRSNFLSTDFIL